MTLRRGWAWMEERLPHNSLCSKLSTSWEWNQPISLHKQYSIFFKGFSHGPWSSVHQWKLCHWHLWIWNSRSFILLIKQLLMELNGAHLVSSFWWWLHILHKFTRPMPSHWVSKDYSAKLMACWFLTASVWKWSSLLVARTFPKQLKDLCNFSWT